MKRKKYRKAAKLECKICKRKIFANGLSSHIRGQHAMSADEYVKEYSEFRQSKLQQKKGLRKFGKVECKICKNKYATIGMSNHLRDAHNLTTGQYVEEHGEFRPKHLKQIARKKDSQIQCEICKDSQESHKALLYHIKTHNITWQDYFIKYFFNEKHPTCSCGCGEKVTLLRHGKNDKGEKAYARIMLPGHHGHRPGYRKNSKEQRERMRKSAIERMKKKKGTWFQNGPSAGEMELYNFVKELAPDTVQNDVNILSGLELDIVIPSMKLAMEYNGGYWHSDLFKDKKYHLNKQKEAAEKGYRLIHVWECDWFHKKEIIKSILKSIMNRVDKRIYARKTVVKEISYSDANTFLDKNHLQGSGVSKIRLGLFHDDELVSVMTFSSLRRATGQKSKEGSYELHRFCNELNTSVIGGASKLFKYFIKNYSPKHILSYASKDWSTGNLYESLGMTYAGDTTVGYFYTKSKFRYSRFQFQKHKLVAKGADPNLTEYGIMLKDGYHRVWDCGNLKYEMIID